MRRAPPTGFGFLAQGSLQRAYPYALPPGFHATAAGPLTANLAVLPGVNFQPSGPGYNGLSYGRVPYAQGYGEVSARTGGGALYRLGLTYYGEQRLRPAGVRGRVGDGARAAVAHGAIDGGNVGPTTVRLSIHRTL